MSFIDDESKSCTKRLFCNNREKFTASQQDVDVYPERLCEIYA
jgi:hypothetical protein